MIKVFRGVYVHFLTVGLFLICYITGKLETLFITYAIMTVHELAHLGAAVFIGLKPSHITFYPFGVNLKLKNKLIYSAWDDILLYLAGPFANIVMAVCAKIFFKHFFWYEDFYLKNIVLFTINLLPVIPLDGGVVLKRLIARRIGTAASICVMRCISACMVISLGVLIYKADFLSYNFSMWFFLIFLGGNLFTTKEKYNIDLLSELMFSEKKIEGRKTKVIVAESGENLRNVLKDFTNTGYNILCIIGQNGEIEKIMSEREVINTLMAN